MKRLFSWFVGLLAFAPLIGMVALMLTIGLHDTGPMIEFMFAAIVVVNLSQLALMAGFIIDAMRRDDIDRTAWLLVILLVAPIGLPIYWWCNLRPKKALVNPLADGV